ARRTRRAAASRAWCARRRARLRAHRSRTRGKPNCAARRRFSWMRRFALVLIAAGVFAGGASATTFDVHVINFTYTPDVLTVQPGDTVHWIWDTPSHSTTSDDGLTWDSGIHNTGFTFDHLFGGPGAGETFPYHCSFHGFGMAGTIKVGPPTAARFEDFSVARGAHGVTVRWR